jgi:hypothetical protein
MKNRFLFLSSLAAGDFERVALQLAETVRSSAPAILEEPYWVRTFLTAALRVSDSDTIDFLMSESVGKCGKLCADERTMIQAFVRMERENPGALQLAARP